MHRKSSRGDSYQKEERKEEELEDFLYFLELLLISCSEFFCSSDYNLQNTKRDTGL